MKFPKLHRYLLKQYKFWYNRNTYKKPKKEINPKLINKFIIDVENYGSRKMIIIWYKVNNKKYCLYYNDRPMMYSIRPDAFLSIKKYLEIIKEFLDDLCELNRIDCKVEVDENVNETLSKDVPVNVSTNIPEVKGSVVKTRESLISKFLEPKKYKFNASKSVAKFVADGGPSEVSVGEDV